MRRLMIVPIVHSQTDLGSLTEAVNATKERALGGERADAVRRTIQLFWDALQSALQSIELPFDKLLVYQDGLPVIENPTLQIEKKIVDELAHNGSPNHRLVQWLCERGATLIGTESPALLMKEYAAIRRSLAAGFPTRETSIPSEVPTEPPLLEQRDRFIADRIASTLGDDQVAILFIGMAHHLEPFLANDIEVTYPAGRPSSRQAIGSI